MVSRIRPGQGPSRPAELLRAPPLRHRAPNRDPPGPAGDRPCLRPGGAKVVGPGSAPNKIQNTSFSQVAACSPMIFALLRLRLRRRGHLRCRVGLLQLARSVTQERVSKDSQRLAAAEERHGCRPSRSGTVVSWRLRPSSLSGGTPLGAWRTRQHPHSAPGTSRPAPRVGAVPRRQDRAQAPVPPRASRRCPTARAPGHARS